jgi:AbrB family looped-hinge helix DNA binding protein
MISMETVTISPKYQVTIPLKVRESLGLQPGQKVHVILYENRIELIPVQSMREMRGFLRGTDTTMEREDDRLQTTIIDQRSIPV